jgi:hypothetical protein
MRTPENISEQDAPGPPGQAETSRQDGDPEDG